MVLAEKREQFVLVVDLLWLAVLQIELVVEQFEQVEQSGLVEYFGQVALSDKLEHCFEQFMVHDKQVGLVKQLIGQVVQACINKE